MFGKLNWSAIPFDQPIPLITSLVLVVIILGALALVTVKGWWPYLWREWITSVDHKRIGVMYILLGVVMLIRGFADAIMMRSQQALAINAPGYLPPEHYNQIFSAHGTIMIFFAAMPLVIGFMNFVTPLQLGVRDVAFPTLNSGSFWLTATGALLVNVSLFVGEFSRVGWLPYPPLSEAAYSPGVGVDYYLWAVQISGIGTLMTGINFVTTVLKMRCPGMTYFRMPMFCWTTLAASLLIVAVFPILTATLAMLSVDRFFGWHYFTNTAGGNPMMFVNLIWAWGHPEVYILVLPAFGIFSEVFSTFSGKPLFGYRSMVAATLFICIVAMMTWLHHFFTMGAGPAVNTAFGISTSIIAVGTGVKIYNWIFTMYGGRVRFSVPMLWSLGFIFTFVIGGMTGVLLAIPPADFLVHNSMFLVAHFHNVIVGAACQVTMLVVSILKRDELRDVTGDPWDGRSLEWATPSPAPFFNYAVMPNVEGEEAYWDIKQRAIETQQLTPEPSYEPIEMPVNSPVGFYTAVFATITGFSLIWQIWWLAALGLIAAFAGFVVFAWRDVHELHVPVEEVARVDRARRAARAALIERLASQGALP